MGIFKLLILFALITILKVKSIKSEKNAVKIAPIEDKSLVPVIERIEKGMSKISERLNEQGHNIQSYKKDPVVTGRFSIFKKPKLENPEILGQQKSYYKLAYLLETLSKSMIDAIIEVIRMNNGHLKLLFVNFWIYAGLLFGVPPGFLMFIGYNVIQIMLYVVNSPFNLITPIIRGIKNYFYRAFPTISHYLNLLIVQSCGRGLARIKNIFKRGYGFQHVK